VLPNVERELSGARKKRKRYPFKPDDLLPWWSRFDGGEGGSDADDEVGDEAV
jgi:hypothetical protein